MSECNADLGHPCDANDGEPCGSCAAEHEYWRNQWERYGKHEMRNKQTREQYEADVRDAYSDPTEKSQTRLAVNGDTMRDFGDLEPNGYCSTSGFPEWGFDEPDPDPYEDPNETPAELEARVKRNSAWAKKYLAEMESATG